MATTVTQFYSDTLTSQSITPSSSWTSDIFDASACDTLIITFVPTTFTKLGYIALNRIDPKGHSDTIWSSGISPDNIYPIWGDIGPCDSFASSRAWGQNIQIVIGTTDPDGLIASGDLTLVGKGQS
jgi:hypothetical protein